MKYLVIALISLSSLYVCADANVLDRNASVSVYSGPSFNSTTLRIEGDAAKGIFESYMANISSIPEGKDEASKTISYDFNQGTFVCTKTRSPLNKVSYSCELTVK